MQSYNRLTKACLIGTELRGVDLRCAIGLEPEQIKLAMTDGTTRLPAYLRRQLEEELDGTID